MDHLTLVPNDVLNIILSFVESLKDSFALLKVCKRLYHLLKKNNDFWKHSALTFWDIFKNQVCYPEENCNLEKAQAESGKDWYWLCQCFVNNKICKDGTGIQIQGQSTYGLWISHNKRYIGNFINGDISGKGTVVYDNLYKFKGQYVNGRAEGEGTIMYLDGTQYTGIWKGDLPQFDARHPKVRECIEKGLCTNTLPEKYMQKLYYGFFCEHCWRHCLNTDHRGREEWFGNNRCNCLKCKSDNCTKPTQ
jgi:hypothetical protein